MSDLPKKPLSPQRRRIIQGLGTGLVVAPAFLQSGRADPTQGSYLFPLGVASGDPSQNSVVLWTRLVEDPITGLGLPNADIPVLWEVALDPGMTNVVAAGQVIAQARYGHNVKVRARRLPVSSWLYYRFTAQGDYRGQVSRVGRTRTFPLTRGKQPALTPASARQDSMRFAIVSCQNYVSGFYPAWGDIARQDLDFVVHTGDYIYEGGAQATPLLEGRNHVGGETVTLDDYRNRYALYRLDQDLQEAHAQFPFIVTWDDHEVENNYAGLTAEETSQTPGDAFVQRRRDAYQAYYEAMPVRKGLYDRKRGEFSLARKLPYGDLADLHVLDTRQFRTDQPAGDGFGSTDINVDPVTAATLEAVFGQPIFDAAGITSEGATLLGSEQEAMLYGNLTKSSATWNVLAQQIMMMPWDLRTTGLLSVQFGPDFPGRDQVLADIAGLENLLNVDAWDGYLAARDRLFQVLDAVRPGNPVVLTGDIHSAWGARLLKDFGDPANSDMLAAEFVCTSISSTFAGADPRGTDAIVRAGIPDNPHIGYFDGRYRGYCLCDVNEQRWLTQYRAVGAPEDLFNPDGLALVPMAGDPVFTAAEAEVVAGFNTPNEPGNLTVRNFLPA